MLTLMESGQAQGALGRARTLHEIAVAAVLISEAAQNDPSTSLAQRFLDHRAAIACWDAIQYQKVAPAIGYDPFTDEEMVEIEAEYEGVRAKYGKEFCRDNGWAATLDGGKAPTVRRMEELAGLSHRRSHYSWSSHEVHADSQGWHQNISEWGGILFRSIERSIDGLIDPAHMAAIALNNVTLSMLMSRTGGPTPENVVAMNVMTKLVDDVGNRFLEAHEKVERLRQTSNKVPRF